jgi:hypothetical protein
MAMSGQTQVTQLVDRIERDIDFASALEVDSLTTLRDSGFDELGNAAAHDCGRVGELVERIYGDEGFRRSVEEAPRSVLGDWGIPEAAMESVLIVAGAPEEVVERASADVEAHLLGRKPLTFAAAAAVLGALAFAQEATAGSRPETPRAEVVSAAVSAQVAPEQARAAMVPEVVSAALAKTQVSHAAWKGQVGRPAWKWHGVGMQRVTAQHLASVLRVQ